MKKIAVALSGGVDSAVAAYILKKKGFNVCGVFFDLFESKSIKESCKKAKKISEMLGIEFLAFNFRKEFKKSIIDYFIESYRQGITPNPCVLCNQKIKFELFLSHAKKFDFIATGHYARLKEKSDGIHILKGIDRSKDQSYFLYRLNQKQLKKILFPLGVFEKTQVKKIAKKIGFYFLNMKESQEVCFMEGKTMSDFMAGFIKNRRGDIIDQKGNVLGQHQGLWTYTIGQRKGIGISGGPYFVLEKNLKKNLLVVTKQESDLERKNFKVKNINWIIKKPNIPLKTKIKIRYNHKEKEAIIKNKSEIIFLKPQRAITSGQSAVFYSGIEVLGGGIIL